MTICLTDFRVIRPDFEQTQESALEWIANAHTHAEMLINNWTEEHPDYQAFSKKLREDLFSLGLGENKIQRRGSQIEDHGHQNWEEMKIYNVEASPEGSHLGNRMEFYDASSFEMFKRFYPEDCGLPPHLIHVTCTGYVAPSPAQRLVSLRKRGRSTTVTHAYHMGCYGSIPAIRMAMGHHFVNNESTDIIHTEFCTLHMNPTKHTKEQLVVQSLFADGFIGYSLKEYEKKDFSSLKILAVHEEVIDDSTEKMTWNCHNWGFQMSLSKEIPVLIRRALEDYLVRLVKKAGLTISDLSSARFAIHPGGPKVIEQLAQKLALSEEQISHSKEVLSEYGNMSSATLPHVWEKMLNDEQVKSGELIVSLAFGPGLSICGGLFEKG